MGYSLKVMRLAGTFPLVTASLGLTLASISAVRAGDFTVLHSFNGTTEGGEPVCTLIQSGTKLYGTTDKTLFAFDTVTNTLDIVHTFTRGPTDGEGPARGALARSGNILYGTTIGGGAQNNGTIYSFDTSTNTFSILHSFSGGANGERAQNSPIFANNIIYGSASGGTSNYGLIYAYDLASKSYSELHSFAGPPTDGGGFNYSLHQSGDLLYGFTDGGGTKGRGSIFAFNITTGAQTILHSFVGPPSDGYYPYGTPFESGNLLYGMTQLGGAFDGAGPTGIGGGTLFSYDLTSDSLTVLHSFAGRPLDGTAPYGSVIQSGNVLYGMTEGGGQFGPGTIFAYDTSTSNFTILHSLAANGQEGLFPWGDLLLSGNRLYGVARGGGEQLAGTLFSFTIPEPASIAVLAAGIAILLPKRQRMARTRFCKMSQP